MANQPKKTLNFLTGADIEVNDPDKGGVKPSAQPVSPKEEAKASRAAKASAKKEEEKE